MRLLGILAWPWVVVFVKMRSKGDWFVDRIDRIDGFTKMAGTLRRRMQICGSAVAFRLRNAHLPCTAIPLCSLCLPWLYCSGFSPGCVLSVIRLSFSSFCFPSMDCGFMASLPGLELLFYWESVFEGGWFFDRIDKNDGINKMAVCLRRRIQVCAGDVAFRPCNAPSP